MELKRIDTGSITNEAAADIASAMQINGKMLLGCHLFLLHAHVFASFISCAKSFWWLYLVFNLRPFPLAIAWVRHADRRLFLKFPEVVFMDFTAHTTKVSSTLKP